jgi:hypothetical protein
MSAGKKPTSQIVGSLWAVELWPDEGLLIAGDEPVLVLLSMGDEVVVLLVPLVPLVPDGM